jgi:hypothetical protein
MIFMDSKQNLSVFAKEVLDQIESSEETKEGKGMIVILGFPSTNEATACVFSLRSGTTASCRRDEFVAALAELIQAGFIFELDRMDTQIRYKLRPQ